MKYIKLFNTHAEYETYISGSDKILPNLSYCKDAQDSHLNRKVERTIKTIYNVSDISNPTKIGHYSAQCSSRYPGLNFIENVIIDGEQVSTYSLFVNDGNNIGHFYQFNETGIHTVDYIIDETKTQYIDGEYKQVPLTELSITLTYFYECPDLISIYIPEIVNSIDSLAFYGNMNSISVSKNNKWLDSRNNCNAIIETATNKLIIGCSTTIIPDNIITIGTSAFTGAGCPVVITIPDSVTSIGNHAFDSCSDLTSVTIGSGVTSIATYAFYGCSGLTSITSLATTAPIIANDTFLTIKTGGTLTVPTGSTGYDVWMGTGNYYLGKYNWTKVEQ